MGVIDAPQWLLSAFTRSVKALGATQPPEAIRSAGELLIERWSTPDRRFHNLRHLIDMLARVDELAEESHNPDIMRVACWYHGCVFSSDAEDVSRGNGGEDETASAAFAEADLYHLGVPMETVKRVCSLIVNLKRHMLDEHDIDAQALIDADLGTLAVDPQTYAEYVRLLREEYSHIPMEKYLRGRLTIVSRLLNREHLFHSPLGERWEHAARENLSAEQRRLKEKLTKLITEQSGQDAQGAQDVAKPFVAQATARSFPAATSAEPAATGNGSALEQPDGGVGSDPRTPPLGLQSLTPSGQPAPGPSRDGDTLRIDTAELRALRSMASPTTPAAAVSPASPLSATSPRTPARGVPAVSSASARRPAEASTEHGEPREDKDGEGPMSHTASMESCVADLDLLMCSRNRTDEAGERRARVQAERDKLAEKLRAKTQEAKELREARTGEIAPITEEIIDDGAGDL
ncbi:hypothetical protein [Actinomyces naeslundii]|uniref:Uncharacterized protein n=1 Tax=Actinomyces naeslundii TaxID=1655 RepID=A0AA47FGL8_ACTNA|nr:hypothetical protein [Actinomyces naeslundii]OMG13060.1 hypothetical protein BKH06_04585 [Actinomyces naeslundii]OMG17234.1 hypothetical protein BKH04_05720 [Actinomyces naeslundii]PKY95787.1 hypothetical protein CYJ18_00300 [Actinomyces naeslundii]WAL41976.1 hypothetical protein OFA60_07765 [Actinomyces naeslundii]